jgi:hypothetical protein
LATPRKTTTKRSSGDASKNPTQRRASGTSSARRSSSAAKRTTPAPQQSSPNGAALVRGAVGAVAGATAIGLAGRAALKRARRPRVLGVTVPRDLMPRNLDLKKLADLDVKKVAKQVTKFAEQLERTSEDVRMASAQAKRVSKRLS